MPLPTAFHLDETAACALHCAAWHLGRDLNRLLLEVLVPTLHWLLKDKLADHIHFALQHVDKAAIRAAKQSAHSPYFGLQTSIHLNSH